jgi:hypothetical protein
MRRRRHLQSALMVKPAISDPYHGNRPTPLEGMQLGVLVRHQDDGVG